jgi:hypothetical protein
MQSTNKFDTIRSINANFETINNRSIDSDEFDVLMDTEDNLLSIFENKLSNTAKLIGELRLSNSPLLPVALQFNSPQMLFAPLVASISFRR